LTIEDIEIDQPGVGEIKVEMAACAICHSDILLMDGAFGGVLPAVYGHEAAGVVVEVGPGVTRLAAGDHVIVTLIRSCGQCYFCSQGEAHNCDGKFPRDGNGPLTSQQGAAIQQGLRTGAFAEFVLVDQSQAVAIDKAIPLDSASLLACGVITGLGAVTNTAALPAGASIVVIGTGGVGLNSVQGAALCNARRNIAIDISDSKLEAARFFGATDVINSTREDAEARVKELTGGRGAEYVFVTVGIASAIEQGVKLLRRGGTLVVVGMTPAGIQVSLDAVPFAASGQRVIGSKMGSARIHSDVPDLVDLYLQGRLKLDELISGRYRLDDINSAIASAKRGDALRNVIVFR
jgi:Zn-dependent alcohol dehydrogenase